MVHELEERVTRKGLQNVECAVRDLYALGYEAQVFDGVVCANALHLVPDLPRALACMRFVLRPGGKIVVPTFAHGESTVSRIASRIAAATGFPGRRRLTAAQLRRAVEHAGFGVHRAELFSGVIPIAFVAATLRSQV